MEDYDKTLAELRELFESLRELRKVFRGPNASILTLQEVNR